MRIIVLIAVLMSVIFMSCSSEVLDTKKVLVKRHWKSSQDNSWHSYEGLYIAHVDTMYHVGDTVMDYNLLCIIMREDKP